MDGVRLRIARWFRAALGAARAGGLALTIGTLPACAHGGATPPVVSDPGAVPAAITVAELETLKSQLAARGETIEQLEGRLALLEASQRQLRNELEAERSLAPLAEARGFSARERRAEAPAHDTLRIGARPRDDSSEARGGSARFDAREPSFEAASESRITESGEPRPLLRLHADRKESEPRELSASWSTPTPSEKLVVSPLPALPSQRQGSADESRPAVPRAKSVSAASSAVSSSLARGETARFDVPASNDDLYLHALDLLRRRELPEALRELDAFVRALPSDPRHARAQFWRGEILFTERQFSRALVAYEQALVREPSGDKAADALLRIARCHRRLGAIDASRAALLRLRTQFPESAAAQKAEHELEQAAQEDT